MCHEIFGPETGNGQGRPKNVPYLVPPCHIRSYPSGTCENCESRQPTSVHEQRGEWDQIWQQNSVLGLNMAAKFGPVAAKFDPRDQIWMGPFLP